MNVDAVPAVVRLRVNAARFFIALLCLHVPLIIYMASRAGLDWRVQALTLVGIVAMPAVCNALQPAGLAARMSIAFALTAMPIFFVFDNTGRLQIDFHMYFFVVFAMLAVFCDWRPIALAALLTSLHHLLFNFIAPSRVFPTEGGLPRIALHTLMVALECGVLFWTIVQMRKLFVNADQATLAQVAILQQAAKIDSLTKLGNHGAFHEDFEREEARARRHQRPLVLALIDVDDFKVVNDRFGHQHGDRVLLLLAELFRKLRAEDRAYRVGGDEFALLLVETDENAASRALEHFQSDVRESLLGTTVSIGYVSLHRGTTDQGTYAQADAALYEAKQRGRNVAVCFADICETNVLPSARKLSAVKNLLSAELLSVAFQPIWDLKSRRVLGFEALARPNPHLGLSGPGEVFDIAERTRHVLELDRLCVRKSFEAAAGMPTDTMLFVNMTPASLENRSFDPEAFVAQLESAGLKREQVVIELTERRISDTNALIERASVLDRLGVQLALDDTGSGYAGLEILSKVKLAFVKIDGLLLVNAMRDVGARGVLSGIIAIARETGSYLIAEGIETDELFDFVTKAQGRARNVHVIRGVQGYLLGRPQIGRIDLGALQPYAAYLTTRLKDAYPRPVSHLPVELGAAGN